jgi:hypothetical protein
MQSSERESEAWVQILRTRDVTSERSWWITFWLSLLLGWAGADRFYLGSALLGLLKFFTIGGAGLWWLTDFVLLLLGHVKDEEGRSLKWPSA